MKTLPGTRVGAVQSANESVVKLYGYGTYVGDHVPHRGPMADIQLPNPKIEIDEGINKGKVVYGCECWWGDLPHMAKLIGNREVSYVPVPEDDGEDDA